MSARFALAATVLAGCSGNAVPVAQVPADFGTELVTPPGNIEPIDPTWDGQAFAVTWISSQVEEGHRLYFARITSDGRIITGPRDVGAMPWRARWWSRQLFATDDGYVLFLRHPSTNELYVANLATGTGELLDGPRHLLDVRDFRVCQRPGRFDIAYIWTAGNWRVHLRSYDESLSPLGPGVPISTDPVDQWEPSLAWLPSQNAYAVTWREDDSIRIAVWDPDVAPPPSYEYAGWQPFTQTSGHALGDGGDGVLIYWHFGGSTRTAFEYRSATTLHWETPRQLTPDNRFESVDIGWARSGDTVLIAWQDNSTHGLPQITTGVFHPTAGESSLAGVTALTDGSYYFSSPAVTAGDGVFLTTYVGNVEGTNRLYYRVMLP